MAVTEFREKVINHVATKSGQKLDETRQVPA